MIYYLKGVINKVTDVYIGGLFIKNNLSNDTRLLKFYIALGDV